MDTLNFVEVGIYILASILTLLNYYISLRLKSIEEKIKRLEDFEKKSTSYFSLLHMIKGQLDILIKGLK